MTTVKNYIRGLLMAPGFFAGLLVRATQEGFKAGHWKFGDSLDRAFHEHAARKDAP